MNAMTSRGFPALILALAVLPAAEMAAAVDETDRWPYLPNDDIGAVDFKAAHPTYDGRGVVVAILDTGVDAFAPGLTETSTGQVKLIQVRDFSGQGDWKVEAAELADPEAAAPIFEHSDGLLLAGAEELAVPPATDDLELRPVYIGIIPEARFLNSRRVNDLNDDGDTSDSFGFLAYLAERSTVEEVLGVGRGYEVLQAANPTAAKTVERERQGARTWLVVVDTDGDGSLAGESLLRDYRVNYDTFRLLNENAPEARTVMAWSVNVIENEDQQGNPEPPTVEFHFDDGAHGSHCSGIAAGYRVSGQEGLDGVAPGAWVMSLKIGDNRLSGGATTTESMKKAYDYAAGFEEEYGIPVVVNMSYGIASVEEGDDAMGTYLDELLADHPTLYVCTSAGNEGPGLSTIGLPATSFSLISSGAYLSPETAHSLYNTPLPRATLFTFSSRGGETAKPDIVTPGSALSTVPGFIDGAARFQGTSMASPQTAGAVACLVSGALQEEAPIHWGMVKRALIAGASRIGGLGLTDQGGGLLNLPDSWPLLMELSASESARKVLWYRIETTCPFQADGVVDAAYWRTPGGVPLSPETVTFNVSPVFHPDLEPDEKDTFFRSFSFKSEADWLSVVPRKRYIRGDMAMDVDVTYDGEELKRPGVNSARVIASLDGGDLRGLAAREFYLWNTVVSGVVLGPENDFTMTVSGEDLTAAWVHHYFVDVPASASALRARLEVSQETGATNGSRVRTEICDPEGHVHGGFVGYATLEGEQIKDMYVPGDELYPGTWEIAVASSRLAKDAGGYKLTVSCDGYHCEPEVIASLDREGAGKAAEGSLTVTRAFPGTFRGEVTAAVEGFADERDVVIEDTDTWTYSFSLDRSTPRGVFELTMDEATGNLFTDCAVNIKDSGGKVVTASGFNGLEAEIEVRLPEDSETGSYTLEVVGGFALAEDMQEWGFALAEKYYLAAPVAGTVKRFGGGALDLYCGVPTEIEVGFADSWPDPPEGLKPFGHVQFRDANLPDKAPGDRGGRLVLEVPIAIE